MSGLPRISGQKCVGTLMKAGFALRRRRGSHMILQRQQPFAQLVVPDHDELDRGTLRAIIRQANLTVEQFVELL